MTFQTRKIGNFKVRYIFALLLFFIICAGGWLGLSSQQHTTNVSPRPVAVDGILDLRQWNFQRDGRVMLYGAWQFWRDRLVSSAQIVEGSAPRASLLDVPGRWTTQSVDGVPLKPEGVGTYHLRVLLPNDAAPLAIRQSQRYIAWDIVVNGKRTLYTGAVGSDPQSTHTLGQKSIAPVTPVNNVLDITVQMAAFGGWGGIPAGFMLGDLEQMYGDWQRELALRTAFISACLSLGMLYLTLYILRPSDRASLVFAAMSLSFALSQLSNNSPLGGQLQEFLPGRLLASFNILMFSCVWLSYLASAAIMFPGRLRRVPTVISVILILSVQVANQWPLQSDWLMPLAIMASLLATMVTMIWAAIDAGRQPMTLPIVINWVIMGLAQIAVVGKLGFNGIVEAVYCFMLVLQAVMLMDRLRLMLDEARQSNARLAALNGALEDQVTDRTRHLSETVDRLKVAQDRLVQSEKLASLGRLVAGIAHEVNTPVGTSLTTVTHLAQQLDTAESAMQSGTLTRSKMVNFLSEAKEATQLLTTTVQRTAAVVQSFKQMTAEKMDSRPTRLDLHDLLWEQRPVLELLAQGPNLTLRVVTQPGMVVETNATALMQVLGQLISNAVSHAFPDGRPGTIVLAGQASADGWVALAVEDDGIGIAPEIRPHIFEPFTTTGRAHGRSGLGMHMVYTLVVGSLGGTVAVTQATGGGTRVTLRLPETQSALNNPIISEQDRPPPQPI